MENSSVSYIKGEFDKLVNDPSLKGTIKLTGSQSGVTKSLSISQEQQDKIKAILLESASTAGSRIAGDTLPQEEKPEEKNASVVEDVKIEEILTERFDRILPELTVNIKLGKPTHIAEFKDKKTNRSIKLHLEEKMFKNRKIMALFGQTFDSSGRELKSCSIANYKKNPGVIKEMVISGLKHYSFDGLFELINY